MYIYSFFFVFFFMLIFTFFCRRRAIAGRHSRATAGLHRSVQLSTLHLPLVLLRQTRIDVGSEWQSVCWQPEESVRALTSTSGYDLWKINNRLCLKFESITGTHASTSVLPYVLNVYHVVQMPQLTDVMWPRNITEWNTSTGLIIYTTWVPVSYNGPLNFFVASEF